MNNGWASTYLEEEALSSIWRDLRGQDHMRTDREQFWGRDI